MSLGSGSTTSASVAGGGAYFAMYSAANAAVFGARACADRNASRTHAALAATHCATPNTGVALAEGVTLGVPVSERVGVPEGVALAEGGAGEEDALGGSAPARSTEEEEPPPRGRAPLGSPAGPTEKGAAG